MRSPGFARYSTSLFLAILAVSSVFAQSPSTGFDLFAQKEAENYRGQLFTRSEIRHWADQTVAVLPQRGESTLRAAVSNLVQPAAKDPYNLTLQALLSERLSQWQSSLDRVDRNVVGPLVAQQKLHNETLQHIYQGFLE